MQNIRTNFSPIFFVISQLLVSVFLSATEARPLFTRSQTVAQFFRTAPHSLNFHGLDSYEAELCAARAISNYWARDKRYIIDGQSLDDRFQARVGLDSAWNISFLFGSRVFTDFKMDEIAIQFHDTFHIPQDERLLIDKNRTRLSIPDYGLEITENDLFESYSTQMSLKLEHYREILGSSLTLALMWSYELSDKSLIKKGAEDFVIQLGIMRRLSFGYWYSNFNWMFYDKTRNTKILLEGQQWSSLVGLAFDFDASSLLLQALITQSPFEDIGQLSKESYELHLGYRYLLYDWMLELTLLENVIWPFNTPDWGLNLAIKYEFN